MPHNIFLIINIIDEHENDNPELTGPFNMTDEEYEEIKKDDRPDLDWMGWNHYPWGHDPELQDW